MDGVLYGIPSHVSTILSSIFLKVFLFVVCFLNNVERRKRRSIKENTKIKEQKKVI